MRRRIISFLLVLILAMMPVCSDVYADEPVIADNEESAEEEEETV